MSIIKQYIKSGDSPQEETRAFRVATIIAVLIEIFGIACYGKINAINITNIFLDAITGDSISSIVSLVVLFLILQLTIIIIIHIFLGNGADDTPGIILEKRIISIQKNLVTLACDIIEGCVNLFNFMPDFFSTIGILLLDKEEQKDENLDKK